MVPAIDKSSYLTPIKNKRKIKPKVKPNCISKNFVEKFSTNHSDCYIVKSAKTQQYKHSFFIKAIQDWNGLSENLACAETIESFKSALPGGD